MRYILKGVSQAQLHRIFKAQMSLFGGNTRPEKVLVRGKNKSYYAIRHKKKTETPTLFDARDNEATSPSVPSGSLLARKTIPDKNTREFGRAKATRDALEQAHSKASKLLGAFLDSHPKGAMNLVPEHVKQMPEYKRLRASQQDKFRQLQEFNAGFVKRFKEELKKDRQAAKQGASAANDDEGSEVLYDVKGEEGTSAIVIKHQDGTFAAILRDDDAQKTVSINKYPTLEGAKNYADTIKPTKSGSSSTKPHEMTSDEYEAYAAKLPEFGDTVITPDGKLGTMRGGRMGSERVEVEDVKGNRTYATIGELQVLNARKKQHSRHHNAADTWLEKVSKEVARLEEENAGLFLKRGITKRFRRAVEEGTLTQSRFDEMVKEGKLLSEEGLSRAAAVEKQIDEVRESPIEIPKNSLHESLVQRALNAGGKVPAHVLAEYPGLRKEERKSSEKPKSLTDEEVNGVEIISNAEENRLQLKFDGKPPEKVREYLKSRGFRWAPSKGAWQRHLSPAAEYAGKEAAKMMGEVNR